MANQTREILRRIRSIKNIGQVTKAMEAVSAAKMRKAQQQVLATRPYAQQAREVLVYLARLTAVDSNLAALMRPRDDVKRVGILLVTADRGLAGGLNANVIREAARLMRRERAKGREVEVVTIGKKGRDWLLRFDPAIRAEFTGFPDNPTSANIGPITHLLVDDFLSGHFDEVYLVYTNFENTLRQYPVTEVLLPVTPPSDGPDGERDLIDYIFEPSPEAVLNEVLYNFVEVQVLQAVFEAIASEHSARMVAMRNATDAAGELVDSYQLIYNKARQESITSELMDIIGGTAALENA